MNFSDGTVNSSTKKEFEAVEFQKVEFTKYEKKQNVLNTTTKEEESKSKSKVESIDDLEKYADLLKKGILTQQEFDAKKKQILGL